MSCLAKDNKGESATDLFAAAKAATDIEQRAYRLRAHVRLQLQTMLDGELIVDWNPPEQRRVEIRLPGYTEIRVLSHGQEWLSRPLAATPMRVMQALDMLKIWRGDIKGKYLKKIEDTSRDGRTLTCTTESFGGGFSKQICFDALTHVRVSEEHRGEVVSRTEYDRFEPVGDKLYPRRMSLSEKKKVVVEVRVDKLEAAVAPEEAFAPLSNVQPRPACAEPTIAQVQHAPDPEYSTEARLKKIQGTVILGVTIGADGKVKSASVLRSLDPSLDRQAANAVLGWQFRPAMCGNTPVPIENTIEVNFRLF